METVGFKDLYFKDYTLKNYIAVNKKVENNQTFKVFDQTRITSVFVYLKDCNIKYLPENGEEIYASKGSVVYIPCNAKYYVTYQSESSPYALAQLIAFETYDANNNRFIIDNELKTVSEPSSDIYKERFDNAVKICEASTFSHSEFKSILYSVFADIAKQYIGEKQYEKGFLNILPSVEYLKKSKTGELSVTELANMSHVSESCFRRLFKKQFGVTPYDYINNKRIQKATEMLRTESCSISEISQILGFSDSSYFSKVFKKEVGMSPSKYRSQFRF